MLDLYHATRDELIRIILDQRDALADQEQRIAAQARALDDLRATVAQLTTQVGTLQAQIPPDETPSHSTPAGMPGLKATAETARARVWLFRRHSY